MVTPRLEVAQGGEELWRLSMRVLIRVIDSISEWTGKAVSWVCVLLVLVLSYEVVMRYGFNNPTFFAHELSTLLGGTIAVLSWAYTHRHNGHVRVDVIYARLSPRGQAIVDVLGSLLFFFPLIIVLVYNAWISMWFAWEMGEVMIGSFWYPPAGPIKTVMVVGLSLFAFQNIAQFIRNFYMLTRGKLYD